MLERSPTACADAQIRELLGALDINYEVTQMALLESILKAAAKRKALREESEEEARVGPNWTPTDPTGPHRTPQDSA